jgi:predicted ATP-dependent serine protease
VPGIKSYIDQCGVQLFYIWYQKERRREVAKAKNTAFFCSECGYESAKWFGQCPACKAWNTFVEEPIASKLSAKGISAVRKESTYKDNHPVSLKRLILKRRREHQQE